MPHIVNLSSLITLYPHSRSLAAFTLLTNRYSEGMCCSPFLQKLTNYAWVALQYKMKGPAFIEKYKKGGMTTDEFLERLHQIFDFLTISDLSPEDIEAASQPGSLHRNPIYNLLAHAWNAIIGLEQDKFERFEILAKKAAEGEPVYLISNTNELNMIAIISLLMRKLPNIDFLREREIDISIAKNPEPVEICPNVFLCLSYRYQLFKGQLALSSTDSLLNYLVENQLSCDKDSVVVVSQYNADILEAQGLGISNTFEANEWFVHQGSALKKTI